MKKSLICRIFFFAACLFTLPSCSDDIDMDGTLWVSDIHTSDLGGGNVEERYGCMYFGKEYVSEYKIRRRNGSDWRSERVSCLKYSVDGNTILFELFPNSNGIRVDGNMFSDGVYVYHRSNLDLMEVLLGRFSK